MIFGKLVGGFFGFLLAGPIGLILGVFLGHFFDKGIRLNFQVNTEAQKEFFKSTFLVMGYVAKSDGHVTQAEVQMARRIMQQLGLQGEQLQEAMRLFNQGKTGGFDLNQTVGHFRQAVHGNPMLLQLFMQFQVQAAMADGNIHAQERVILLNIARILQFPDMFLDHLIRQCSAEAHFQSGQYQQHYRYYQQQQPSQGDLLTDAYEILGVTSTQTNAEIKKAYRKLMSQHHPDKLIAQGLPENMIKAATEKTQTIQRAYELISKERNIA